jgi:glycosyltransferase involved in cell wall biosynthesis
VVVPVYNGERYLAQNLESILAQTLRPAEILVLNDASTDRTAEIALSFGDAVSHWRSEQNLGQFANVNRGIELARGDLIAVFHADDVYDPDIIEVATETFEAHPSVGAVFCRDRFIDSGGEEYASLQYPPELRGGRMLHYRDVLENLLLHKNRFLRTPGAVVRRSVYEDVGLFRTDLGSVGDYEMWVRIARTYPIMLLDRCLYSYRHTPGSEGASYQSTRAEPDLFFRITNEHLDEGGRDLVSRRALNAFEAHLAEDQLLLAARAYAQGKTEYARELLGKVRLTTLLRSPRIQRYRLALLRVALGVVARLPHSRQVAGLIRSRWGAPG